MLRRARVPSNLLLVALGSLAGLTAKAAQADAVVDWNLYTIEATKGFDGTTGTGVTLDSNLGSRIEAIEGRAVFDAVNSVDHFSSGRYYSSASYAGSAAAAAVTAAHDVVLAQLPNPAADPAADARWSPVRTWVDQQWAADLAALGVPASDGGIAAGHAAAAAANTARALDNSSPVTSYGSLLTPTTNPGLGVWRQSNAGAVFVNPATGAPTGFDATGTVIQGRPAIDLNWRDVTPFSLTTLDAANLAHQVALSPTPDSSEFSAELRFITQIGRDVSTVRTADQTAQALYYKQDAEIFVYELARLAVAARGVSLDQSATVFALLANAIADARIGAWMSKYEQKFWRPITAANANSDGAVTNNYVAFHPVAATPSHPSNTSGHSATAAAGAEILRAFFGDKIRPDGSAVTLGNLPWLTGTNPGTGNVTTRQVSTFSQLQLENGASRLYLGVHFGFDNYQGQWVGLATADAILCSGDPAARGLRVPESRASLKNLQRTLLARTDLYGFYGRDTGH